MENKFASLFLVDHIDYLIKRRFPGGASLPRPISLKNVYRHDSSDDYYLKRSKDIEAYKTELRSFLRWPWWNINLLPRSLETCRGFVRTAIPS